ncbi:MAG: hypothetical protein K0Q77_515 [Anaerosporomusa subterranea]|nr:hypothetical protein [Anaerosporomusa subterranea]
MGSHLLSRFFKWGILRKLSEQAGKWKAELYVLYLAARDGRTPVLPKIIAAVVVGYAFSPIDFIPDFIPLLGYVDDVILVPLGIMLALHLIPPQVLADCRRQAALNPLSKKVKIWAAGAIIVAIWLAILFYLFWRFVLN